jgi:UDP-N-acetylglucosamine 2-epimerase (non-hydrolysing)
MSRKIALVVGARPNFMKSAPLLRQLEKYSGDIETSLVHTGQHYDYELSRLFFEQLKMREPDIYLGVGSDTHALQTAQIMMKLEEIFIENRPDLVVVFGDVNSTMAASIVAAKLCIDVAHVEAGLRSFDNNMPEEINRIVTDRLSHYLFVTEESGRRNLLHEGAPEENIYFVGNIMIDSLVDSLPLAEKSDILEKLNLVPHSYAAVTMHRPSNVDDKSVLDKLMTILEKVGKKSPVVFPCHPRTMRNLREFGLDGKYDENALRIIEPLGYLDFLKLQKESSCVLTDSGGIQEETTYLGIPCLTIRKNTERPATVEIGSNTITGLDEKKIYDCVDQIRSGSYKNSSIPELWDGKTAERIADILAREVKIIP